MRVSDRVNALKPSSTLAVSARVTAMAARGIEVIDFGLGEPDFDTPGNIRDAAIAALRAGKTRYTAVAGEAAARQAVAEKLQRENGITCTPDDIVISAGAKFSIYLALHCLLDPGRGQEVILPTPAWVSYRPIAEMAGGVVIELPGELERGFRITPAQLEAAIGPRTSVFIFNSPSNPCGTMYSPDEVRALAAVLARHPHIAILTDEIYEKLVYGPAAHLSMGSIASIADRVITVNGMSKAFAMTGWRIGYACAPGAPGSPGTPGSSPAGAHGPAARPGSVFAAAMTKLQGQTTNNITSFTFDAVVEAMRHGAADTERIRARFEARAAMVARLLRPWPRIRCPEPTGAFYVFPEVRAHFGSVTPAGRMVDSSLSFAEALLEEAQVAVVPGDDFGACAAGHVRISYACPDAKLEEGLGRIERWLTSLRRAGERAAERGAARPASARAQAR
jgi:aspartate aminotransferase